jgi:mono/diheme cytochrome c family protein
MNGNRPAASAIRHCSTAIVCAMVMAPPLHAGSDGTWKSGAEAYEKVCARCHQAGVGPELRGRKLAAAYVKVIARNGMRAMPSMPVTALDEATLDQIAAMIEASPAPAGTAAAPAAGTTTPSTPVPQR